MDAPAAQRTLRPSGPLDLAATLAPARRGPGDPTMHLAPGWCWRATDTPSGPATLHLRAVGATVEAQAWGDGATFALDAVPTLLGLDDRAEGFEPRLPKLVGLARRHAGVRHGRTAAVPEALTASILEQKVTGIEARASWAWLVRRLGRPAPGPAPTGLRLPVLPAVLAATPTWVFHQANVERKRADTVRRAMGLADRLAEITAMTPAAATARLLAVPGVGVWTAAEVARVALGDPDAVSVGDFHLKHLVSWGLAREPRGTDERMLELLAPWAGHRGRVIRLLAMAPGARPPRYGPRLAPRSFARI